ncbi:MAG: patatin-like phospholipase family protein [Polyangiales bacterium]
MSPRTPPSKPSGVALILAGAVAKGAFEAGVIAELIARDLPIRHLVATSAGALNATLLASGLRAREGRLAAAKLDQIWRDEATWTKGLSPTLRGLVGRRGLSTQRHLLELLHEHVHPTPLGAECASIQLTIVVAAMNGRTVHPDDPVRRMTTYERWMRFENEDFDEETRLVRVFDAAVASSSFPGAFVPYDVTWSDLDGPAIGPCVDGGTVNNTPVRLALHADPHIDTIVVVSASPRVYVAPRAPLRGLDLIGHLGEMLINERLYRDLKEARRTNEAIAAIEALPLSPDLLLRTKKAAGLEHRRIIDLVTVFADEPLAGGAFDGLGQPELRAAYLDIGRRTGARVCDEKGW